MSDMSTHAVGCDIGGTNCMVGLIDSSGNVHESFSFPVDHDAGIVFFLDTLLDRIGCLLADRTVRGVGVLLPGYLKDRRSVPYIMVNIPMLENVALQQKLENRFGISVALDIDRNGPCLAEYLFHYREGVSRLMYVTIGTGVGVGLVVDGAICRVCNDQLASSGMLLSSRRAIHAYAATGVVLKRLCRRTASDASQNDWGLPGALLAFSRNRCFR